MARKYKVCICSSFVGIIILIFILTIVVFLETLIPASGYRTVLEYSSADSISAISSLILTLITISTLFVALREYNMHVEQNKNKIFSSLDKEYLESEAIQNVVKYLQIINPSNDVPTEYQVDLFLRFFEEIGLYLDDKVLDTEKANHFFGYYLKQIFMQEKGRKLLLRNNVLEKRSRYPQQYKIKKDFAKDWKYLDICIQEMEILEKQNIILKK
ncbi:MAG: hypothetical protein MJZ08_03720 [Bacteroidaceae bacterium]|nr:hypothetical protein [Bacteroidaceae bacterium]